MKAHPALKDVSTQMVVRFKKNILKRRRNLDRSVSKSDESQQLAMTEPRKKRKISSDTFELTSYQC